MDGLDWKNIRFFAIGFFVILTCSISYKTLELCFKHEEKMKELELSEQPRELEVPQTTKTNKKW